MKSYNISVRGKVQGVWFRKYTQEKATQLGLLGFVMNKNDGSVYIETIGKEDDIKKFVNWLNTEGSPLSTVDQVITKVSESKYHFTKFEIKR